MQQEKSNDINILQENNQLREENANMYILLEVKQKRRSRKIRE